MGLGGARPQHPVPPPEDTEREPAISRGGTGPLNLPVDSTGIEVEGEWNARKHGGAKRRIWRKRHIGIDEETLEGRAVEVTAGNVR